MLSDKLLEKLTGFFDLDKDEYRESHRYYPIDEDQMEYIRSTAKHTIKVLPTFTEVKGRISIDEKSVAILRECIEGLHICMRPCTSWHRESTVFLVYMFLQNAQWTGKKPKYITYDGWGPIIFDLSSEQLAYYLWWREEARTGTFHEATGEYLWLYIYDVVLNTCYTTPEKSLAALEKLFDSYSLLSPVITHKRLSQQKLGWFITNYALYNGITSDIEQLLRKYGIDDYYDVYHSISNGCFAGLESHLLMLASSTIKTKAFNTSAEMQFVLSVLSLAFEDICKICRANAVNILGDLCGSLTEHASWNPYESPILSMRTAIHTVSSDKHTSFQLGKNIYIYATGNDLSSNRDMVDNTYSFYHNDSGERFHRQGFYYRKKYSGPNETAKQNIDYVIRRIQIVYRSLRGGRTIKEVACPYKEIKLDIDTAIQSIVSQQLPNWEQNKKRQVQPKTLEYKTLLEDQITVPSRFKYTRNISKHVEQLSEKTVHTRRTGFMMDVKKTAVLKERFDILKDKYSEKSGNSSVLETLSEKIIVPMLELDFDEGCKMWKYALLHYYGKCYPVYYHTLTDGIVGNSDTKTLAKVFRENDTIKKHVFLLDPYENHLYCEWFIRDLILIEEYDLADELITLYSQNNAGDNNPKENLFSVLSQAISSSESKWKITSKGIDFLNHWIAKIQSQTKRAELEVSLLSLIDCVEGNASKGGIPFSMFMEEDGLQLLMEDRLKSSKMQEAPKKETRKDSFSELMESRKKDGRSESENLLNDKERKQSSQERKSLDLNELESCRAELDALIGLQEVKTEITSLTNLMRIRRMRSERGMNVPDTSQHLVFSGNPGTGKTTVARIIGKVYHALGFLSKGHLVEVDRSGLVAGYVGQTAIKTQEVIQCALGGILFIDEAYSLSPEQSENDFGQEAIDTILKAMEDNRDDFVVIVAGYGNLMPRFIESNPGLKSRFNKYISFPDYDGNELFSIFRIFLQKNDYMIDDHAAALVADYLNRLYQTRDDNFGNARDVRNLFEKMITKQANRLVREDHLTNDAIARITADDLVGIIF